MKEEVFRKIVEENYCKIYRICYRYFGNKDEANDACQDTLLKAWINIGQFRGEAEMSTWMCRIAVNVCMTYFRTVKRNQKHFISGPLTHYHECVADDTENNDTSEEMLLFFRNFMSKIQETDRTLVALYLEELDTREISSITGLSEANVRTRIHRIKKQIKSEWEGKNGTR